MWLRDSEIVRDVFHNITSVPPCFHLAYITPNSWPFSKLLPVCISEAWSSEHSLPWSFRPLCQRKQKTPKNRWTSLNIPNRCFLEARSYFKNNQKAPVAWRVLVRHITNLKKKKHQASWKGRRGRQFWTKSSLPPLGRFSTKPLENFLAVLTGSFMGKQNSHEKIHKDP